MYSSEGYTRDGTLDLYLLQVLQGGVLWGVILK